MTAIQGPPPTALPPSAQWRVEAYPSGTVVVTRGGLQEAYFYVWGAGGLDAQQRYQLAEDLRDWLNGGARAAWLDTLFQDGPEQVVTEFGNIIQATGPWHDASGQLDWKMQEGDDRILRGVLIECLVKDKRPT